MAGILTKIQLMGLILSFCYTKKLRLYIWHSAGPHNIFWSTGSTREVLNYLKRHSKGLIRQFHGVKLDFQALRLKYWNSKHSAMLSRGPKTLQEPLNKSEVAELAISSITSLLASMLLFYWLSLLAMFRSKIYKIFQHVNILWQPDVSQRSHEQPKIENILY